MSFFRRNGATKPKTTQTALVRLDSQHATENQNLNNSSTKLRRLYWRKPFEAVHGLRLVSIFVFAIVCIVAVSVTLTWRFEDNVVYNQQVGEAAKDDVVAPKALTYVSQVQTQKAEDQAANDPANNVYHRDEMIVSKQRDGLNNLLTNLSAARDIFPTNGDLSAAPGQDVIRASGLTRDQLSRILNLPAIQWNAISAEALTTYNLVMAGDIQPANLTNELGKLKNDVYTPWNLSPAFGKLDENSRYLVVSLVYPFITTNNTLDNAATKIKQDSTRKKADQVSVNIIKGQSVVRRGEVLSQLQVEQLQQLGLRSAGNNLQNVAGTVGIVTALILLMVYYFSLFHSPIWGNSRMLLFIGLALVVASSGMRLLMSNYAEHNLRLYLLPLAAVAMVLAALLDVNLALFFMAVLALLAGYIAQSPEVATVFFVGGAAGAFTLYKAERTITFVYAGAAVAVGQFVVVLCFNLASRTIDMGTLGLLFIFNLGNGLVSTSLAFFIFSALGKLFGVTTVIQLLELAHPNQPLLRRLMREAPGTYHHSILVSNLAEQAAERLMGDALLARVGAYYHDIGKLSRPSNFIDNQGGGANIHDSLDPRESARLIKAHVEDGVVLARKNHLPHKVIDIIHQHHGTCMISFFYQKALAMGLDVSEIDFRYPGPKPQTKVAAIVMLSDGVEAAVRANVQSGRILTAAQPAVPAAQNPATNFGQKQLTIDDVVNKIIDDRIRDHQLDECDLTLKDIDELRHLFVEILAGIYHPRIIYPDSTKPAAPQPEVLAKPEAVDAVIVPVREIPMERLASGTAGRNGGAAADGGEVSPQEASGLNLVPIVVTEETGNSSEKQPPRLKGRNLGTGGIGGAGHLVGAGRHTDLAQEEEPDSKAS